MKLQKSDTTLNEKDAIMDMLESEKQLMSFYTTALFEGSSKSIRKGFSSHLNTVAENQYCLYNQLSTRGYYTPAPAQKQIIDSTCETFKKQKKQLSGE
ncbi:MAG: spore coat protein [Clostridia bacterium]|nr:spore coat protein [Clostridia bacterium]